MSQISSEGIQKKSVTKKLRMGSLHRFDIRDTFTTTYSQSISEFVTSLRSNIANFDFTSDCDCRTSIADIFLRTQFVRGITDNSIRKQLLQSEIFQLKDIVSKSIILEASKTSSSLVPNEPPAFFRHQRHPDIHIQHSHRISPSRHSWFMCRRLGSFTVHWDRVSQNRGRNNQKDRHQRRGTSLTVIHKTDGGVRLCVDYKVGINERLTNSHYPIKKTELELNNLRNSKYFCRLDLSTHPDTDNNNSLRNIQNEQAILRYQNSTSRVQPKSQRRTQDRIRLNNGRMQIQLLRLPQATAEI
ncbi:hypothetical protein J6590_074833 [Homalodisca vitripennis]|nr:hypothetical protein J6590_074833 [Homalodisca vitripennis]